MSIIYATALKSTRMGDVVTAIGVGSTYGYVEILTSTDALLCTLVLADPCGSVTDGVLTFTAPLSGTATGNGTAAKARVRTSDDDDVIVGLTVGTSASDIVVATTTIAIGNTVTITSAILSHG